MHGVDVGAPQVRDAHARVEALEVEAHYSQQDGSATDFPDGHFDLVTSMLVTHECPAPVIRGLFKEARRLLAPGGIMLMDGGSPRPTDPFVELSTTWFGMNANEPFSAGFRALDYPQAVAEAGFRPEDYFAASREPVYLKGNCLRSTSSAPSGSRIGGVSTGWWLNVEVLLDPHAGRTGAHLRPNPVSLPNVPVR